MTPLSPSSWDHCRHYSHVHARCNLAVNSRSCVFCHSHRVVTCYYTQGQMPERGTTLGHPKKGLAQWWPSFSARCYRAYGEREGREEHVEGNKSTASKNGNQTKRVG